jgi:tryptophan halogenase
VSYHPLTDVFSEAEVAAYLDEVAGVIAACTEVMPTHGKFIADNCAAPPMPMRK